MVTAASKYMFSGGPEPYLTMIAEGQANISALGGQTGDLLIVCAARASTVNANITSTNLTQAFQQADTYIVYVNQGGTDTPPVATTYYSKAAIFYAIITPSLTSFNLANHTNYDAFIIRNANGPLYSASVFAATGDTDGDHTISTATNKPGTVRAVAINAVNTAKYVLNGINIGTTRTKYRETALGYESNEPTERIFGGNDTGTCQDCVSIDPQSGTGSLRLDSAQFNAAAAAVFVVN